MYVFDSVGDGGEWIRWFCLGTGVVLDVCLCMGYSGVGGEWVVGIGLGPKSGRVG